MLIYDPLFYAVSIPAVLLYGIAKGGFAGPLAILGVPLMSLVISPLQAAAILLPILCIQDMISIVLNFNQGNLGIKDFGVLHSPIFGIPSAGANGISVICCSANRF